VVTLVICQLVPRIAEAFLPPGKTLVMREYPGPFAGWLNLWIWLSLVGVVLVLPGQLLHDRRIRRRSRELGAFVLWRINGLYKSHRPEGGVVPVHKLGLLTSVRSNEVERAQWFAELKVHELTGHRVTAWDQDNADRPGISSWIAHLPEQSGPGESPRERSNQYLAGIRTIEIWMRLGIKELNKFADGESFGVDYPRCPVCRSWVANFENIDGASIGVTFTPCGCSYLIDQTTKTIRTTGGPGA
jgi:hypothetical protein